MKELLLDDANRLCASLSEYEATQCKINLAEYKTFALSESEFNDLVFMETNDKVWVGNQKLVDILTPKGRSRTLKEVVGRIMKSYPYESPIKIFKHLFDDEPWFDGCFIMRARFDLRLFGELLVRPLADYEKVVHPPEIKFYLEDGNHRALVYVVFLRLGAKAYEPVRVIFSQDWSHIYPWAQLTS